MKYTSITFDYSILLLCSFFFFSLMARVTGLYDRSNQWFLLTTLLISLALVPTIRHLICSCLYKSWFEKLLRFPVNECVVSSDVGIMMYNLFFMCLC